MVPCSDGRTGREDGAIDFGDLAGALVVFPESVDLVTALRG